MKKWLCKCRISFFRPYDSQIDFTVKWCLLQTRNSENTVNLPSNSNISSGWLILIIGILITKHGRVANDISPESWYCSSALRINKSFRPAEKGRIQTRASFYWGLIHEWIQHGEKTWQELYSGYYRCHRCLGYMMILLVVLHQPLHIITQGRKTGPGPVSNVT